VRGLSLSECNRRVYDAAEPVRNKKKQMRNRMRVPSLSLVSGYDVFDENVWQVKPTVQTRRRRRESLIKDL